MPDSVSPKIADSSAERQAALQLYEFAEAVLQGTRALRQYALSPNSPFLENPHESKTNHDFYVKTAGLEANHFAQQYQRDIGILTQYPVRFGTLEYANAQPVSHSPEQVNLANPTAAPTLAKLVNDVPKCIQDLCEDIDMQGHHLDVFLQEAVKLALKEGECAILVDYFSNKAAREEVKQSGRDWTAADDKTYKVRPFLVLIPVSLIIYAVKDQELRYWDNCYMSKPDAPFEYELRQRIRVIRPNGYELYEKKQDEGSDDWQLVDSGEMPPQMPIVNLSFSPYGNREWLLGRPLRQNLLDIAENLFKYDIYRQALLRRDSTALFLVTGIGQSHQVGSNGQPVPESMSQQFNENVPPLAIIKTEKEGAKITLAESSGKNLEVVNAMVTAQVAHGNALMIDAPVNMSSNTSATGALIAESNAKSPYAPQLRMMEDCVEQVFDLCLVWSRFLGWAKAELEKCTDGGSVYIGPLPSGYQEGTNEGGAEKG